MAEDIIEERSDEIAWKAFQGCALGFASFPVGFLVATVRDERNAENFLKYMLSVSAVPVVFAIIGALVGWYLSRPKVVDNAEASDLQQAKIIGSINYQSACSTSSILSTSTSS
jgi:hypothetical protein